MYCIVSASIPLGYSSENYKDSFSLGRKLEETFGSTNSAGTGMGYRDLEWSLPTREEADALEVRIYEFLSEQLISTDEGDENYSGILVDVQEYEDED